MLETITRIAAWDPMGISNEEPASYSDRLKLELKTLRAGVRSVVESAQGIPTTRADDAASLIACLREVMQEQRDEAERQGERWWWRLTGQFPATGRSR